MKKTLLLMLILSIRIPAQNWFSMPSFWEVGGPGMAFNIEAFDIIKDGHLDVVIGNWNDTYVYYTTTINEEKPAGKYEIRFDGSKVASGVYFYTLTIISSDGKKQTITKKMILLSEIEKKQEEEYEMRLIELTKRGDKAAQVELSERMKAKSSPLLRKFILEENHLQNEEIVERIEQ